MSIILPKKQDHHIEKEKEELRSIDLPALNATFNIQTGEWVGENDENKAKESKLQSEIRKEEMKQRLLMHMLTDKEVKLNKTRKEIALILKDHSDMLEMQGFPVKGLLSNIDVALE